MPESRPEAVAVPNTTIAIFLGMLLVGVAQSYVSTKWIGEALEFPLSEFHVLSAFSFEKGLPPIAQMFTYVFPHGGWWHMWPNAIGLLVYGAITEQRLGWLATLALFFASGVVGLFCQTLVPPVPPEPVAGASLAICGLLGSLMAFSWSQDKKLVPYNKITTLIELFIAIAFVGWSLSRVVPSSTDITCSAVYHLLPFFVMWMFVRWYVVGQCLFRDLS